MLTKIKKNVFNFNCCQLIQKIGNSFLKNEKNKNKDESFLSKKITMKI
jgi:hypothetical protein